MTWYGRRAQPARKAAPLLRRSRVRHRPYCAVRSSIRAPRSLLRITPSCCPKRHAAFAALNQARRTYVHGLLEDLPTTIERLHPRDLVPPMSAIAALTSVNFPTAEATGVSMILGASIVVSTRLALTDRGRILAVQGVARKRSITGASSGAFVWRKRCPPPSTTWSVAPGMP